MARTLKIETKTKLNDAEIERKVEIDVEYWTFTEKIKFLKIVLDIEDTE